MATEKKTDIEKPLEVDEGQLDKVEGGSAKEILSSGHGTNNATKKPGDKGWIIIES